MKSLVQLALIAALVTPVAAFADHHEGHAAPAPAEGAAAAPAEGAEHAATTTTETKTEKKMSKKKDAKKAH